MLHIVLNSLGRGGAERSVLDLFGELLRRGHPVRLVLLHTLPNEYAVPEDLAPYVVRLGADSFVSTVSRLHRLLRATEGSRVFSLMPQANIVGVLVGRLLGLPTVTSERTTPSMFYKSPVKLALALSPHLFSSRSVFISHFALAHGLPRNAMGRAVRRKACVLHNPVSVPVPTAQAADRRLRHLARLRQFVSTGVAGPEQPLRLLLASRMVTGKGVIEFLETVASFIREAEVTVVLAGTGPLEPDIRQAALLLGINTKLEVLGFVDDISFEYARSDVVVLTSDSEGFGRVGFEAYLSGCLVIGLERNSFCSEIALTHPAWMVVKTFSMLGDSLDVLSRIEVPDNYEDIVAMKSALSVTTHTKHFLDIILNP